MIKNYDYTDGTVKEITEAQYDFLQMVIKHSGRIDSVLKEYPVPTEDMDKWRADPIFWPMLEGYLTVLVKSRGLSVDKVKEFLLDTIVGQKQPTKEQLAAANAALKALGVGVNNRNGFKGEVTVTPSNTTFVFEETRIDGPKPESNQGV